MTWIWVSNSCSASYCHYDLGKSLTQLHSIFPILSGDSVNNHIGLLRFEQGFIYGSFNTVFNKLQYLFPLSLTHFTEPPEEFFRNHTLHCPPNNGKV